MNNFGVIEVASGKSASAAPGWAYVPEAGPSLGAAATQTANRKRARNPLGGARLSYGDLSARQEAKMRKEVEALDRDAGRDVTIPLPVKSGRRPQAKSSANVRKIMQSQKTFANHLDDFLAMQALAEANPAPQTVGSGSVHSARAGSSKRPTPSRRDGANKTSMTATTTADEAADSPAAEASVAEKKTAATEKEDALLVSRVPPMPSDEQLAELLAHPPLTYLEARGRWNEQSRRRIFCEVCGYWGRVRCIKCGTNLCALDCLQTHQEECVTRYGL